ncbi:oligonucleotide/oligosaccharide-binding fold domain-containing protein, partial [Moraxella catarrhalis]
HRQLSEMMAEMGFEINKQKNHQNGVKTDTKKGTRLSLKSGVSRQKSIKQALVGAKALKVGAKALKNDIDHKTSIHYANIHRALLSALLSFVAHKTDTVGEYLMARSQKARIFPASTLHKKGAQWVMAFEVVETSQVYMRTLAKIEPEWIIKAAPNLLKYHYFEPHWSKKAGRVRAYAQISLFGLIVIAKELVNFEQIDLVQARE